MASKKVLFGMSMPMLIGVGLGAYLLMRPKAAHAMAPQPQQLMVGPGDKVIGVRGISGREVVYDMHEDGWWYEPGMGTAGFDSPNARQAFPSLQELLTEIEVVRLMRGGSAVWMQGQNPAILLNAVTA